MTREEAIIELKLFKESAKEWNVPELVDALDMAIESLSADSVSREEALQAIDKCRERKNKEIEQLREFYSQQPTIPTFAESAEAYKEWTGEEMGKTSDEINEMNKEIIKDILKMMPTAYLLEALGVSTFEELTEPTDKPHGRLIDADKLKKQLDTVYNEMANERERKGLRLARWFLISAPTVSADAEWTPVCSELPEMNEDVLVTLWGDQLEIGYFTFGERGIGLMFCANNFEIRGDESVFEEVDAWMPLPKPYKGGDSK